MFNELKTNLREFGSNYEQVIDAIQDVDKLNAKVMKVLVLQWDTSHNELVTTCSIKEQDRVTKRAVASTIASIHHPVGWILSLIHRSNIFCNLYGKIRQLGIIHSYRNKWRKWKAIIKGVHGFQRKILRALIRKSSKVQLISFADDSSEAVAACAYLITLSARALLMAKRKLPSSKSNITMPKLKLNALTLATRLTSSVLSQLMSVVNISSANPIGFGDSAEWAKSSITAKHGTITSKSSGRKPH